MTSRRERHDDDGFAWPPTQDDLDALNVLALDVRPGVAADDRRGIRPGRHRYGARSVEATRHSLPERGPVAVPRTIRPVVPPRLMDVPPPHQPRSRGRARPPVSFERLALLASGMVIGLALAAVGGLRTPPDSADRVPSSPRSGASSAPAPAEAAAPLPHVQPASALTAPVVAAAVSTGGTIRQAASRTPASSAPREPSTRLTRTAAPPEVTRPEPASESERIPAAREVMIDGVAVATPDAARESPPSGAAPALPTSARPAIVDVLRRYQAAYSRMDVSAARAVWPSVDARALARGFGTLAEQALAFGTCEIAVVEDRATAMCPGTLRYRPRVGSTAPQRRNGRWEVGLARGADGWSITSVNVR